MASTHYYLFNDFRAIAVSMKKIIRRIPAFLGIWFASAKDMSQFWQAWKYLFTGEK